MSRAWPLVLICATIIGAGITGVRSLRKPLREMRDSIQTLGDELCGQSRAVEHLQDEVSGLRQRLEVEAESVVDVREHLAEMRGAVQGIDDRLENERSASGLSRLFR